MRQYMGRGERRSVATSTITSDGGLHHHHRLLRIRLPTTATATRSLPYSVMADVMRVDNTNEDTLPNRNQSSGGHSSTRRSNESFDAGNLHLINFSLQLRNWLIFGVLLLFSHVVHNFTPPPAPAKLLQKTSTCESLKLNDFAEISTKSSFCKLNPVRKRGCGPDLMHSRAFRSVQLACRTQPSTVIAAFEGIQDAMTQCADRMRFQQWDCSNVGHIMHDPPILKYGYRESALIWALSSAGAAWGVATACAQGWIEDCSCAHDGQPGWEYGGCSYSVQHGITASRKLLTRTPIIRSPLRSVEKHNLKAGRLAVKKTLISSCKCHGVSGSCQQKTCWKKTATLNHITDYLVDKYTRSRMLTDDQKPKNSDLVFIEPSPDPCRQQVMRILISKMPIEQYGLAILNHHYLRKGLRIFEAFDMISVGEGAGKATKLTVSSQFGQFK
ncbi:Abnormal cell lineage protein 44 [Parelaphostrongylus tenuis]|uniref:Protein Wnt n=1 Tax=Parelaphostrongylus tenuis TaxID=148309 RepID=A0AAD5WK36_PARTN|nr:Abnormal cell lineage protein 44 [Parelaphostrongylus tenuis]